MTKQELQHNILNQPYNREHWQAVLKRVFGATKLHIQPPTIVLSANDIADSAVELGGFYTKDERQIGIYEITLKPNANTKIAINRVGLRDLLRNVYKYEVDAALIVFVQGNKWRFSYVSEIKTEEGKKETEPKRYTYLFGENEICRTAADRFGKLLDKKYYLQDLYDAFSVEKLNKDFFTEYKNFYKKGIEHLVSTKKYYDLLFDKRKEYKDNPDKQQKPIRDFVKKLLGRIVFLHFLQKKEWMGCPVLKTENANEDIWEDGSIQFMAELFKQFANKESFHSQCLQVLFLETLNTKRKNNIAPFNFNNTQCRVPYLNGGLFDTDKTVNGVPIEALIDFPTDYFDKLFDFFEQYNFTIDENDPYDAEVGIDPEMLGHIFENLLEDNKDKGAFYTPKEIVHYMCQESLIQYLRTHLPECIEDESQGTKAIELFIRNNNIGDRQEKKNYIVNNASRIEAILDKVKICDPAIGSGAFPMGMLQQIFKAKTTLDLTLDKAKAKKEIIQNSIYGVDIEKGAVDIARLRFWLALVVDEITPQPLPNLDYKIMQGNSLLESFEEVDLSNLLKDDDKNEPILYAQNEQVKLFDDVKQTLMVFDKADKQDLQKLINLYFDFEENTKSKYKNKAEIKQAINTIIEGKLKAIFYLQKNNYEAEKQEAEKGIAANTIKLTDPKGIVDKKTKNLALVTKKLDAIAYKINHLTDILHKLHKWENEDKERPYFLWHTYFKDVFDNGGFDIVIGNPPYLRVQGLEQSFKKHYEINYKSATGAYDLYILFTEKGFDILNKTGVLNYIQPDKWINGSMGKGLRQIISNHINKLISFKHYQVFNASTYSSLLWINKTKQNVLSYAELENNLLTNYDIENWLTSLKIKDFSLIKNKNLNNTTWTFSKQETANVLNKISTYKRKVKDIFDKIFQGIATSMDNVYFLLNCREEGDYVFGFSKSLQKEVKIEKAFLKPLLKGDNVHRYESLNKINYIIFPYVIEKRENEFNNNILMVANEIINKYPLGWEYLKNFESSLRQRENGEFDNDQWYQFSRNQGLRFETIPKLLCRDICQKSQFTYDINGTFYTTTTVYGYIKNKIIKESDLFFLALLNSSLTWFFMENTSAVLANGYYRYMPRYISEFSIPEVSISEEKKFIELSTKILSLKSTNNSSIYYENKIDALVFHLYGLTEVEMNQVLDTFKDLDTKDRTQIQNEYKNINNNKFRLEV